MVTQEFMVKFYRCLASSHWDKRKAFEQAKAAIKQRYPEPFYWAGFIMID
jgi:CHAT domain-containing protein